MTATNWTRLYVIIVAVMAAFLAFLVWATPRDETGFLWTDPMIKVKP